MSFFGLFNPSKIKILEGAIKPLRFKVGELGSQIAIDKEKGLPTDQKIVDELKNTIENLTYKLQELKEQINYQSGAIKDKNQKDKFLLEIQRVDKEINNLSNISL